MNNREALLAGAKQCLLEKGFSRTTARDIAAASRVSLAAIGYHFRSTEALLGQALLEIAEEWDAEFRRTLDVDLSNEADVIGRFEAIWGQLQQTADQNAAVWRTQLEVMTQLEHLPEAHRHLAAGMQEAREGMAELFLDIDVERTPEDAQAAGSFFLALMSGVLVQKLVDPERAPTASDLAETLRLIASRANTETAETRQER